MIIASILICDPIVDAAEPSPTGDVDADSQMRAIGDPLAEAITSRLAIDFGGNRPGIAVVVTKGDIIRGVYTLGKANWEFGID